MSGTAQSANDLIVLVVGRSGAGKSSAIKTFEDLSFATLDNLPLDLIENVAGYYLAQAGIKKRIVIGTDIRHHDFAAKFAQVRASLEKRAPVEVLFLTADEEVLLQRFITTRRKHPLLDEGGELVTAIRREAAMLEAVERSADCSFDTTAWSTAQLARHIEERYSTGQQQRNLYVTVVSFGFMHGMLRPADSIYDVRFLKNPYYDLSLKDKTGLDPDVRHYVFDDPVSQEFMARLVSLNEFLLPKYHAEGKHYFRIGIGCTGGKHRSVAVAEELARLLAAKNMRNIVFSVVHRDVQSSYRP